MIKSFDSNCKDLDQIAKTSKFGDNFFDDKISTLNFVF